MLLLLALHGKLLEIKGEAVAVEEMGQDTWGRSYSLLLGKTIQKCGSALPPWENASSTTLTHSCRTQDFCQISLVERGKFLKSTGVSVTPSPCQSSSAPPCTLGTGNLRCQMHGAESRQKGAWSCHLMSLTLLEKVHDSKLQPWSYFYCSCLLVSHGHWVPPHEWT